jgi:hypothetical protein
MDGEDDAPPSVGRLTLSLQLLAAAIGFLVILWLVNRVAPSQRPTANPSPTQSTVAYMDFRKFPRGVPLFYYIDSREPGWLQASDWTGRVRGTRRL